MTSKTKRQARTWNFFEYLRTVASSHKDIVWLTREALKRESSGTKEPCWTACRSSLVKGEEEKEEEDDDDDEKPVRKWRKTTKLRRKVRKKEEPAVRYVAEEEQRQGLARVRVELQNCHRREAVYYYYYSHWLTNTEKERKKERQKERKKGIIMSILNAYENLLGIGNRSV